MYFYDLYFFYMKGETRLGEEVKIKVNHCDASICLNHSMSYGASNNQLVDLVNSASQCYQTVSFECISSPLKVS